MLEEELLFSLVLLSPDVSWVHPENRYLNGFSDIISLKIAS
jgi:hypothetical protein